MSTVLSTVTLLIYKPTPVPMLPFVDWKTSIKGRDATSVVSDRDLELASHRSSSSSRAAFW